MERAFLGISHSPLIGLNSVAPAVEQALGAALAAAREQVRAFAPELVVLVAPDHYNGFFNEAMPPFCIGTQANAVGDYPPLRDRSTSMPVPRSSSPSG